MVCLIVAACNKTGSSKKISPEAARQMQLDWNLKTLVDAYQDVGNTDPKWDEPATNALAEFVRSRTGSFEPGEDWSEIIRTNCDAAVQAGCDDPMVRYLYIRFAMSETNSAKDFADAYCGVEDDMQQSSYPDIRKFYVSLRALQQIYYAYPTNYDSQPTGKLAQDVSDNLTGIVADKNTPPEEVYEACSQALNEMSGSKDWYERFYNEIEKPLFVNWGSESVAWLLKGQAYIQMAWFARGNDTADKVTKEGWQQFRENLDEAEKALDEAWKLNPKDPRIPRAMLTLELGQGKGRDRMELWFQRGMALDTNYYDLCFAKLYYLEPKWYGSTDAMLEFGRECVTNQAWGGHIPLILLDAHKSIQRQYVDGWEKTNYWKQPEVWVDIKSAFNRFFELNPNAIGWYHNYAWYAYQAEQWDTLNEIIPKLGPINYAFFGGKDEFDKMVEQAKKHTSNPK